MTELGELDRRAKLDLIEDFAKPGIGELRAMPARDPNKLVQLVNRYPSGEQADADLFQPLQHVFTMRTGVAPFFAFVRNLLNGQHAIEYIDRACPALRGGFGAGGQLGRELISGTTFRAVLTTDRARGRGSRSRNLHWCRRWWIQAAKLHAAPLKKP